MTDLIELTDAELDEVAGGGVTTQVNASEVAQSAVAIAKDGLVNTAIATNIAIVTQINGFNTNISVDVL